jgi:hypothetical protein
MELARALIAHLVTFAKEAVADRCIFWLHNSCTKAAQQVFCYSCYFFWALSMPIAETGGHAETDATAETRQ